MAAVTRQDLIDWHHAYVHPNNIILGIVGDFDSAAMEAKLRVRFSADGRKVLRPKIDIQFHPAKPGYYLVPKNDVNQSNIRMVELGIRATILTTTRSGVQRGVRRRLLLASGQDIRTKGWLTRGRRNRQRLRSSRHSRLTMGTKSRARSKPFRRLPGTRQTASSPITDDEIKRAKDAILNSFVFNFDSPDKVLDERMAYEFYGYPADFLERFRRRLRRSRR